MLRPIRGSLPRLFRSIESASNIKAIISILCGLDDSYIFSGKTFIQNLRAWRGTEEGKNWYRAQRTYTIQIEANGSFSIEDVPAGTYSLQVSAPISDPTSGSLRRAELTREIRVPEMAGGRSDIPLNLGRIVVPIIER